MKLRALLLCLTLASPAAAEVGPTSSTLVTAHAGMGHRVGSGPEGRLATRLGLGVDLSGWYLGLQGAQIHGAGALALRFGGEFGYRFGFGTDWLRLSPLLSAGYAQTRSTEPRVEGVLHGVHADLGLELGLGGEDLMFVLRPSIGGVAYRNTLVEPWLTTMAGLVITL